MDEFHRRPLSDYQKALLIYVQQHEGNNIEELTTMLTGRNSFPDLPTNPQHDEATERIAGGLQYLISNLYVNRDPRTGALTARG